MLKRNGPRPSALQFYWYEIERNESFAKSQFMGAVSRLIDLADELVDASKQRDVPKRLHRVTRIIESYLHRAYELRERAIGLLGAITKQPKLAESIKSPKKRAQSLAKLRPGREPLVDAVDCLVLCLDDDMLLRNMHTHEQFLGMGLWLSDGPYDPDDVLMQFEYDAGMRREITSFLRIEMRKLVKEYLTRIDDIREAGRVVADIAFGLDGAVTVIGARGSDKS